MTTIVLPTQNCAGASFSGLATLALCLALAVHAPLATATPEKAAKFYENAVTRYEKNDVPGAIVQLKNAIQQDPKMLAAQILLGRLLLEQGDAAAAETTFEQALRLGVDRSEIAVPMARAALELGKPDKVLQGVGPDALQPGPRTELLIVRGHAHRALRDYDAAARSYRDALELEPKNVTARLALADLLIQQGRRDAARKTIAEAMGIAPTDPRPWELTGKLALAEDNAKAALEAYGKAIALQPEYVEALIGRTMLQLDRGALDEAGKDLETIKRVSPLEPRGLYARALYGARRGDESMVREALQDLVDAVDRVPRDVLRMRAAELLKLGGLAYYGLGQQQKARLYFEDYLLVRPGDVGARKVLASILLSQGWPREAIDVLETARRAAPRDPDVLLLLGSAHMARRRYELANGYLEEALRMSGGSGTAHTALGLSMLGSGNELLGVEHLERALKKDPAQARAGLTLAIIELGRGRAAVAVEKAEAVAKQQPSNPVAHNILGAARTAAGDRKGARAAYEKALALQPRFVAASLNLAKLDVGEGDHAAARARLQGVLKQQPRNREALFELALVEEAARRPDEAIRLLEKARGDRRNVAASVRLIDTYLRFRQPEKALEVAREAEAAAPEDLEVLAALGRAYSANGNDKLAQQSFSRMTRLAGFNPAWQTRIASYQLASGNTAGAVQSLERALSAQPEFVPAQVMMVEVDLQRGDLMRADQRARAIAKRDPENRAAQRLLADIALAGKKYPQAIEGYRKSLSAEPSTEAAIRLYRAHLSAGSVRDAVQSMESWLRSHPDDLEARRALAEGHLHAGDLAAARTQYEAIVAKEKTADPAVLNNLANVLLRLGDVKALGYAEQAHQLAPQDAAIQDTLGWVLVQQGQADLGLRHLRDARLRDPQNPEIRYHLAVALARAGRRDEARQELEQALKGGAAFPDGGAAQKLMAELAGR
jgi:putative PEP-CTERM system TPR-repeat lipoprotein